MTYDSTDDAQRHIANYLVPAVGVLFVIAVLSTSRWNSPDRFSPRDAFVGCYNNAYGSALELSPTGTILFASRSVGRYRIRSAVGGKHGYLVEAEGLRLSMAGDRMAIQPGSSGYFWNISLEGVLELNFAPNNRVILRKAARCVPGRTRVVEFLAGNS